MKFAQEMKIKFLRIALGIVLSVTAIDTYAQKNYTQGVIT
jgi:hypothetical protein